MHALCAESASPSPLLSPRTCALTPGSDLSGVPTVGWHSLKGKLAQSIMQKIHFGVLGFCYVMIMVMYIDFSDQPFQSIFVFTTENVI